MADKNNGQDEDEAMVIILKKEEEEKEVVNEVIVRSKMDYNTIYNFIREKAEWKRQEHTVVCQDWFCFRSNIDFWIEAEINILELELLTIFKSRDKHGPAQS